MSVLESHRQRVGALKGSLDRMAQMHDEAYELWERIVQLVQGEADDRNRQVDALHEEAYALAERIAELRETTFGTISREARLLLTSTVESVPLPATLVAPLRGR